jgi:hypothetical protein
MLGWKNYGNNHTIFDASAGTAPDGSAVGNTNAQQAWAATYPTLMGWNGANTYGVRVDSARVADSAIKVVPRVSSIASASTITPTADTTDQYTVTALATTASMAIPSGTPVDAQKLTIRIKDNGTARALSWVTTSGGYRVIGSTLPTTTVATKTVYIGCIYNIEAGYWDVVSVAQEV